MKSFFRNVGRIVLVMVLTSISCRAADNENQPNVLLIIADDMGYGDLSCHGNPVFKTPNLDRLHDQSIRFTQFHAASMCTPARAELMTGMAALRTGASWVGTVRAQLRTDLPVMPEVFRDSGYRTGQFGKWHLGDNYPLRPQDRGFEETLTFPQQEIGTVNDFFGNDYFDDTYEHNGKRQAYKGYCTDIWFRQAMAWMKKTSDRKDPFFCYLALNAVHGPYFVDQQYRDRVGIPNIPKDIQTFFGEIVNVDDNIGRINAFLEEQGLDDNTIVIFMVDNGGTGGYNTYNAGMRGLKTQLWEGGHRVPFFIRWPGGGFTAPRDIQELSQAQDVLSTLIDLCGLKKPVDAAFEGISLAGPLRGKSAMPDRTLVTQFQRNNNMYQYDACVMRGPWRLVNAWDVDPHETPENKERIRSHRFKEIDLQLFNVQSDPHQDHNVMDQHPETAEQMKAFYETWWTQVEPDLEKGGVIVIGNDAQNPSLLAPTSWQKVYFTQINNVFEGRRANDSWSVVVDRAGEYKVELCRWPKEADTPIAGAASIGYHDPYTYGPGKTGKALPIKQARLKVGSYDQRIAVKADDKAAVFRLSLPAGPTEIKTWFINGQGKELCGAYYVYVTLR